MDHDKDKWKVIFITFIHIIIIVFFNINIFIMTSCNSHIIATTPSLKKKVYPPQHEVSDNSSAARLNIRASCILK